MHLVTRLSPRAMASVFVCSCALGAVALARSEQAAPPSSKIESLVTRPSELCTQMNPPKTARVTPLAVGQNAFVARLEMDPFAAVPEHRDATEETIHVLTGSGTMWIDDEKTTVSAGDTVFMPANAKVKFENGASSMSAIQVFAGPGPAEKYRAWSGCAPSSKPAGR